MNFLIDLLNQDVKKIKKITKKTKKKENQQQPQKQPQKQPKAQLSRSFELETIYNFEPEKSITFCHWNINGFRAIYKKQDFQSFLLENNFDLICLSETKINSCTLQQSKLHKSDLLKQYNQYWSFSTAKKGYSGCAIFSKYCPIKILYGMDNDKFDDEGRIVGLEFEEFFIVNVYVPNSKQDLSRLTERTKEFDVYFRKFLIELKKQKAVIVVGDFNVARDDIDVYSPNGKDNTNGFTPEEKTSFEKTLNSGFVDIWRQKNPDKQGFSWWDYRFQMRQRNLGWRLDYVLVDKKNQDCIEEVNIREDIKGSDHCPIVGIINTDKILNGEVIDIDQIIFQNKFLLIYIIKKCRILFKIRIVKIKIQIQILAIISDMILMLIQPIQIMLSFMLYFKKQCNRFGILNTDNSSKHCQCCYQKKIKEPFKMNTPIKDFAVTNPTITIYFQFLRFAFLVLIVHFIITGIPVLIYFPQIRNCFLLNCTFDNSQIYETYRNEKIFKIAQIVNLLFFIVMKYAFLKLLKNFDFLLEMNNQYNKVSDYSVQVRFPESMTADELIKEFNDQKKGYKVVNCNFAYDIRRYTYLLSEIGKIERQLKILKLKGKTRTLRYERYNKKKNVLNQQYYKEESRFYSDIQNEQKGSKRYRYAYLTFEYKSTVNEIMQELEIKEKKNIKVYRAFEPNDVIWENYGITQGEKLFTRILTVIITLLLSVALYSVVIVIKYYQIKNYDTSFFALIASLMISIIVSIINVIIRFVVSALVKLEKRTSYTIQEHSISIRVSVTYFITNALVIMIAFLFLSKSWSLWEPNGVVVTVTIIMIFGILADGLYDLYHVEYLWKVIKRWWIQYKLKNKKSVFQCEANEAFQGYELDIAERYYQLTKVLSVCFFYQSITPYILLVGIVEIICTYIVQKYTIINRVTRPKNLDFKFSVNQFQNLNFAFYCMIFGQILFEVIFVRKFTTYILIIIVIGVSEYLFDEEDLFFIISPSSSQKFKKEDRIYYLARLEFPSEYDRLNPVTQGIAFQQWLKYLKEMREQAKKKVNIKHLRQLYDSKVLDSRMLKSNLASIQNSMVGYIKQKQNQYKDFNKDDGQDSIKINAYQLEQEVNNKYREAMFKSAMISKHNFQNTPRNNQSYSINLNDLASLDDISRKYTNSKDLGRQENFEQIVEKNEEHIIPSQKSLHNANQYSSNYLLPIQPDIDDKHSQINSSLNESNSDKFFAQDGQGRDIGFVVSDEEVQALKSKREQERQEIKEKSSKKSIDMKSLVKNVQITKDENTLDEQQIKKQIIELLNKIIMLIDLTMYQNMMLRLKNGPEHIQEYLKQKKLQVLKPQSFKMNKKFISRVLLLNNIERKELKRGMRRLLNNIQNKKNLNDYPKLHLLSAKKYEEELKTYVSGDSINEYDFLFLLISFFLKKRIVIIKSGCQISFTKQTFGKKYKKRIYLLIKDGYMAQMVSASQKCFSDFKLTKASNNCSFDSAFKSSYNSLRKKDDYQFEFNLENPMKKFLPQKPKFIYDQKISMRQQQFLFEEEKSDHKPNLKTQKKIKGECNKAKSDSALNKPSPQIRSRCENLKQDVDSSVNSNFVILARFLTYNDELRQAMLKTQEGSDIYVQKKLFKKSFIDINNIVQMQSDFDIFMKLVCKSQIQNHQTTLPVVTNVSIFQIKQKIIQLLKLKFIMKLDIVKELKLKRRESLCQKVNKRIEMPFESSFEIGMGIDAKGSIFASPIDYDESQILSKPNHSKGNSRIFQATNKEENLKQIQITSKIEVCGVCFETSGALDYMANQNWTKNSMNIYIAHCYEGNTKKMLKHPKLRKSAKKFLRENGLQKFIDRYGSHYISGFVNAASFFGQLNIQANSEEEVKKLGTQLKGQLGKIVSKSLETEEKQQLKKTVENCNISSYMDIRGVPVNKSAMNVIDMMEAYQEFIQFFNNKEKEPDFPYKAICDSWLQIEEVAEMQGIHEDFLEIAELFKKRPQVQKIETCENLIYQKEYQKAVEILLQLDLVNLKQLIERLEYQGLVFDLIRLRTEFSKLKEENQRIKFILEDYFWEYRVNEKKIIPADYTGKGFKRYKDGKYFGNFVNGKRHGHGVFQWKDKTRYMGNFIDDKRQGQGVFVNKQGIRLEGEFQQSKVKNPIHIYPTGKKFVGSIVEGQLIQKGELQFDNGTSYEGYFLDEKLIGFGTMYKNKKLASQGFWMHGEFIGEKTCGDEINGIIRYEIKEGQLEIYYSFFEENIILFHGILRNELPIQGQGTIYYLKDIEKGIFGQDNVSQKKNIELSEKVVSDLQHCYKVNCDDESSSEDESDSETPGLQ